MTCTNDCSQGRKCTCMSVTMEDEQPFSFDWVMRAIWSAMRWVGVILLIAVVAFVWGYSK